MKQTIYFLIFSLLTLSCFAERIKAVSDTWPPYIIDMEKGQGYFVEVLKEALKRESLNLELKTTSFSKSKSLVLSGNADILIGCTNDDGNSSVKIVETPLAELRYAFFTNKSNPKNWKYDGVESLRKMKLGVVKGYGYGPIESYIRSAKSNTKEYEPDAPLLKLINDVKSGAIDVFAQDINVTDYTLRKNFSGYKLQNSGFLGEKNSLHLCISENSKKGDYLFEIITRNLDLMIEDGTIAKLKSKYSIL